MKLTMINEKAEALLWYIDMIVNQGITMQVSKNEDIIHWIKRCLYCKINLYFFLSKYAINIFSRTMTATFFLCNM